MSRLDPNGADFDPKKKTVTSLGPTAEDIRGKAGESEEVAMPEGEIKTAASYGQRAKQRLAATKSIKKGGKPLGGAPPIPEGKMQQIADGLSPKPTFGEEPPPNKTEKRHPAKPPENMGGVGSGYHVNQEMARGNIERPVSMNEAKKMGKEATENRENKRTPLSEETIKGLEDMNAAAERGELEPPKPDIEGDLDFAEKDLVENEPEFQLDFAGIEAARLTLVSPQRRKAIEDKLDPLNISDMVTKREIQQEIPVVENQLSYTLRTFNQHEHLFCLQFVYDAAGSQAYSEELLNTVKLVCSLVAINGAPLPEHRTAIGTAKEAVEKEQFEKKMFHVASFPTQMIADMSVQAIWFTDRVNQLFSLDNLKNG